MLQSKRIILRSTEDGYKIKNKLRLTIGSKAQNNKFIKPENENKTKNVESANYNSKRILLFPGENYEFNEKLIHYDVFGFSKDNLVSKKCSLINISKFFNKFY